MATEVFRLFGTVDIQDQDAQKKLGGIDKGAAKAGMGLGKLGTVAATAGAAVAAAAVAAGAAIVAIGVKSVQAADEFKRAQNTLQTSTGATKQEMEGLKNQMLDIYRNNFGESFGDIAESMALVKQNAKTMGLTTNEEIGSMTTNAILLRDTFGFEVRDSVKSVSAMVQNFGITSDEAMNLLAQGTQQGLDRTEELLDSVNEYSPAFKSLGFSAEEMFGAMKNGAESGAFQIDKVGDAFKEFNIRVKDGSKGSTEAFTTLGLDADKMFNDFATGGERAKEAFNQVSSRLLEIEDPLVKNTVGVQLFGTMFEDLETKTVDAMLTMNTSFDKTKDTLGELNNIKYDSFGEAISGIGRIIEADLFIPIGEMLLPILNDLAKILSSNLPAALETFKSAIRPVAEIFKSTFENMKNSTNSFGSNISKLRDNITTYFNNIAQLFNKLQTIATKVFNDIWSVAKPIFAKFNSELQPIFADFVNAILELMIVVQNNMKQGLDNLLKLWNVVFPLIKPIVESTLRNISTIIKTVIQVITGVIKTFTAILKGDWSAAFNHIKNISVTIFKAINTLIISTLTGLIGSVANILGGMKSVVSSKLNEVVNSARNFGSNFINMIVSGINAGVAKVRDAASNVANSVKDFLGFGSPTKEGPASDSDKWIPNLINMLSGGLIKGVPVIARSTSDIAQAILNKFKTVPEGVAKFFDEVRDTIKETYNKMKQDAFSNLNDLADVTQNALKKRYEEEKKSGEEVVKEKIDLNKYYLKRSEDNIKKEKDLQEQAYKLNLSAETLRVHDKKVMAAEEGLKYYKDREKEYEEELKLLQEKYEKQTSEQELYNETTRLLAEENQEELVNLLETYEPMWLDKGRSFAEKFIEGFKSQEGAINEAINSVMSRINEVTLDMKSTDTVLSGLLDKVSPTQDKWTKTINEMKKNATKWQNENNKLLKSFDNIDKKTETSTKKLKGKDKEKKETQIEKAAEKQKKVLEQASNKIKNALEQANESLGAELGLNKKDGKWYLPNGQLAFEVPAMANGGNVVDKGLAIVGEKGPEILEVPTGAKVTPLENKQPSIIIQNNVFRSREDIDYLMNELMMKLRLQGGVITNG